MENIRSIRSRAIAYLKDKGIANPVFESELIIADVMSTDRTFVLTHPDYPLSGEQVDQINGMLNSRVLLKLPLQYLIGNEIFFGYHIMVGKGCLIPRPETELLVEESLQMDLQGTFLDWGTGSGALSVALLSEKPDLTGFAVECSPSAILWAWKNLKLHGLLERCQLVHNCDMSFLPFREGSFDLIVSNPPYIRTGDLPYLMPEVILHEPEMALDGGVDGLQSIYELIDISSRLLKKKGRLVIEVGGNEQCRVLSQKSPEHLKLEKIIDDYSGKGRIISWVHV